MQQLSNKEHICIIAPSLKLGGIERALVVLAEYFIQEKFQVTFISSLKGDRFYKLNERISIIEPPFNHKGGKLNQVVFYPKILFFYRRRVKRIRPDVVLTFGDVFSPLVLLALLGTRVPVFISDRTSPDYSFKFPIPLLKKWLYPKSSGFIAQTKRAADYKKKMFGNKLDLRIIPNAIKEVELYPGIKREKIILYAGRFAWEKNPEILIKAFSRIPDKKSWQLHMAGTGPQLERMKFLAKDLELENYVVFLGKQNDIDSLYAKASIFVLPSIIEGFPNSLCEAMIAGLPVICFDSIPYEELIIPNKNGIVIKEGDTDELALQLTYLIDNEKARQDLSREAQKLTQMLNTKTVGEMILSYILPK